ncbi:MBL fold metallo-hydrolase [Candidatus Woesearchaeota archaeon]|nr:MBL fold metallo-hydrolase [Candidatus Woesearchaeota archaeon]
MIEKIDDGVWKIKGESNCYYLDLPEKTIIDTGKRAERKLIEKALRSLVDLSQIKRVILTHFHFDHIGNVDLFRNATVYASAKEIQAFQQTPAYAILDERLVGEIQALPMTPIPRKMGPLEVIDCPGHTVGSIAIWHAEKKILFSGDTIFFKGVGRTDLPTSVPEEMHATVQRLLKFPYKTLCAGHEY